MKTTYVSTTGELERKPDDFPKLDPFLDDDEVTDVYIDFATYFAVIQWNPGGWRRVGESNYFRSEHLTLEAARMAAKKRYERNGKDCLIYAIYHYHNQPIGSARVVEGYPIDESNYSFTRQNRLRKRGGRSYGPSKKNNQLPEPGTIPASQRYFEHSPQTADEIRVAMDSVKVVGKGGSKAAIQYKNRSKR